MKINIILPSFPKRPTGGHKIMYEYANRLGDEGHDVMVYHSMKVPFNRPYRPDAYLFFKSIYHRSTPPQWFKFRPNIKFRKVYKTSNASIRNADISFYTMCTMSYPIAKLSADKGVKINLVQGYETWIAGSEERLHETYKLPVTNVAISDYLAKEIGKATGKTPPVVYNAVDSKTFFIKTPISQRKPHTVSMLYSEFWAKGSEYGIQALMLCHEQFPDLQVEMFGTYAPPAHLPPWIKYHRQPSNLCDLYNATAIFLTPSIKDGWGLTATEAMFCGCALVSTNAEGLSVFAIDGQTALTCDTEDAQALADNLSILLSDNNKRMEIAQNGNRFVQQYTWERAIAKITTIFKDLRHDQD